MASQYSGNPATTEKDTVRFLIGDTGPTFNFTDEEILFLLNTQANFYMAAAVLSDKLTTIATGGGLASKSIGSLSESYSSGSVQFYQQQATRLRTMGRTHQVPWCAEITQKFSFRQFDMSGSTGPTIRADTDQVTEEDLV